MLGFDIKSILMGFGIGVIVVSLIGICIFPFQQKTVQPENKAPVVSSFIETNVNKAPENETISKNIQNIQQLVETPNAELNGKPGLFKLTDDSIIYN